MLEHAEMDTKIKTLGTLFKSSVQWVVPVYQRHYVWKSKQDDQIPGVWEDWRDQADKILRDETPRPHYFGAIIYSGKKKGLGEIDKMDLVDGQQRLTTFQLAFAAIRDAGRELGYGKAKEIEELLLNDGNDFLNKDDIYKLLPSQHDIEVFKEIVSTHENTPDSTSELTRAYIYFRKEVTTFVNDRKSDEEIETLIDALKDALLNHFQVVTIQLGNYDDAQQIFASLNGKGQPLTPFDLIRNDIFYRVFKEYGEKEYKKIAKDFEKKWNYFENKFWSKQTGRGHTKKARADHFIADAVVAEIAKEVNQHRIAAEYKNYAKTIPRSFNELNVLRKYGESYYALQKPKESDDTSHIANMLSQWDLSTMNPLVMWIDTRSRLDSDDKKKIFLMIESYVVRREICNLTTKHFNRIVPIILDELHKNEDSIIETFKSFLKNEETDSKKFPTDDDILLACKQKPIYTNMSAKKLTYILKCIEEKTANSKFREHTEKKKISIEHIMPQGWKEHWQLKTERGSIKFPHEEDTGIVLSIADQELVAERENLIHTIGNLTLVTRSFNSRLSNKPWIDKKDDLRIMSDLKLNVAIAEHTEWNEGTIKERSAELAGCINQIWKHPST